MGGNTPVLTTGYNGILSAPGASGRVPGTVTAHDAVTLLNEALAADRMAVEILIGFRINCSQRLAFHPTIQVTQDYRVGMLGILNGIFGLYENTDLVCAVFEDGRLVRFVLTKPRVGEVITAAV